MQIKSTKGGIKGEDCCYLFMAIMLMLGGYCAIPLYFLKGTEMHSNENIFILLGSCYLIYMIYSCCTSSSKYLRNCTNVSQVFRNIDMAIRSAPKVTFRIQCYHYETRIHTSTDSEGKTTTTTSQERVNTHYATDSFAFSTWQDHSPPASVLHYLGVLKLARLRTYKTINFTPQSHRSFKIQESNFISRNNRDIHYDYSCDKTIPY
jgi:hypothetical protein